MLPLLSPLTGRRAARLAAIGVAFALAGCSQAAPRRAQRVPIVVAIAEQRGVPHEIEATGTVEPIESASVTAQVGGLVTKIRIHEGDEVKAGQILFEIDPRAFAAAAERAAAVLERSRAQLATANADLARAEKLAAEQVISGVELDNARRDAAALHATVRGDSAALVAARLDLANATVRAPVGGKTGAVSISVGDLVKENETASPLVTINQIRPIRVRFVVPQSDLADVRKHRTTLGVSVATGDSNWITGRLAFVDNAVEPQSGTLLLKGEFGNQDAALWPGEFVRVRLQLYEQEKATVVPSSAVTNSQTGPYLYIVKADTTVEVRPIQVTRTWRDLTVVASGVEPGETVVTDGQLRLSPGAKAQIRDGNGGATTAGESAGAHSGASTGSAASGATR